MSVQIEATRPPRRGHERRLLPVGAELDASLQAHEARYGPRPDLRGRGRWLADVIEAGGLRGRGGAGFPSATKLRSMLGARSPILVANGTEGEPASAKDAVLLATNPHLVLDGAALVGEAIGAERVIVAVSREALAVRGRLEQAIAARPGSGAAEQLELATPPHRFVAGQETALVQWLSGGPARPTFSSERVTTRGVHGSPTLVHNVETLATVALLARDGAGSVESSDPGSDAGSMLVTLAGGVLRQGVIEVPAGTSFDDLLALAGGATAPLQAVLVGGYLGTWLRVDERWPELRLSEASLRDRGASLGARTIVALPHTACGVAESARMLDYLAAESAAQCGPCLFGLRAIAGAMHAIAKRRPGASERLASLHRWSGQVVGRGACHHPDGAVALARSAVSVFADEIELHLAGRCSAVDRHPVLPDPARFTGWR